MQQLRDQCERFGARLRTEEATAVRLSDQPGGIHEVEIGDEVIRARTVILAMGAQHRKLGVPGEEELSGRGVSYCATCDAAFFRDVPTVVVGGGDSAMEEAMFLSKFAAEFRASKIMVDRARETENLELLTPFGVEEFTPGENGALTKLKLANTETGEKQELDAVGAFIAVGHVPTSGLVKGQIDLDDEGYVSVDGRSTRTNLPGVFGAGDLVDSTYRQA
ncbi:MAG: FAD-dependent oxidoreductase, partial [Solirubrobacterales bacterium]|nr:FAD-dependent oxidoreductase [Solirubrobacterales bacterium]